MVTKTALHNYATEKQAARGHDPEDKPIFSILLFENPNKEFYVEKNGKHVPSGFPDLGDSYEVGFYYELESAISALESNACDIHEGCYNAAFILCRFAGLYPGCSVHERMYYVWDKEGYGYVQVEEPKIFKHVAF